MAHQRLAVHLEMRTQRDYFMYIKHSVITTTKSLFITLLCRCLTQHSMTNIKTAIKLLKIGQLIVTDLFKYGSVLKICVVVS